MRNDQHIPCCEGYLLSIAKTGDGIAFGHQMIADQALRSWRQQTAYIAQWRYREPPRARAYRMVEYGAGHAHRIERLGQSIHALSFRILSLHLQGNPALRQTITLPLRVDL